MAQSESEPANSSSGEEEEASSEGSESESEPDKTSTPPPSAKKTQLTHHSFSDESDSESESDTVKNPKPLASVPMDDDQSKKPRSKKTTARYSPPPVKPPTGKRPAAEVEAADPKRIKQKTVIAAAAPDADNGGEKKQLFQRLWSEENEIELIQGMIDYVNEKGKDPVADVNNFHDFVKKSLHVDVNNKQVIAKVRRLKKKYENNVTRAKNTGKVRSFSNPHEKKMYELSTNLWGNDNKNAVMSSTTKKVKINVTPKLNKNRKSNLNGGVEVEPEVTLTPDPTLTPTPNEIEPKVVSSHGLDHGSMGFMITDDAIMSKGLELLSGPKKGEMEEKWRNIKVQELKLFLKKVELLKEQRSQKSQPCKPQGLSITEEGESSRLSDNDHSTSTRADLEKRVAFLETQLIIVMRRMERMTEQNHITGMRVRTLEEGREVDHLAIDTIVTDLTDARTRLTDVETRIAGLQGQIDATNTLALRAEGRSVSALQSIEDLQNLIE